MRHTIYIILLVFGAVALPLRAQHIFQGASLSEALIELDQTSKRYDIAFVYDELEDFTVTKTIRKGRSLPDAVREVCGFYPVRVMVRGREIFVECIQKDRTKLVGRLVDEERQPVAYANITLFHQFDSTYIGGGVSNEAGDFVIPCGAERARVRISCVGFKTVERVLPVGHVGTIRMQMENIYLSNVTVGGRLPVIRSEADRLQYIVANDRFAQGQSVLELLSRVPMVTVTHDYASILGKGAANFMLNGRVIAMSNEVIRQKLWSMRAEDIERIEVISNPSGRYQTDAGGGYINIVLNRDQTLGLRGDLTGLFTCSDDWSEKVNGSVSYASRQFDVTLSAEGEWNKKQEDLTTRYAFSKMDRISDNHQEARDQNFSTDVILRYLPNTQVELGAMATFKLQKPYLDLTNETDYVGTTHSVGEQYPHTPARTFSLTAYCDWQLDSLGKQLSLTCNFFRKDDDNIFNISTSIPSDNEVPVGSYYKARCMSQGKYDIKSFKLDGSLPWPFATVEAGLAYTIIQNEADVSDKRLFLGFPRSWSSDYNYEERTKAFYLTVTKTFFRQLTARGGIRFERTVLHGLDRMKVPVTNLTYNPYNIATDDEVTLGYNSKNNRIYSQVLPSFYLNYRFLERQQLSLNWTMNISRPNFNDLNPFEVYYTATSIKTGNPALLPSTHNNVELSYTNGQGLQIVAYYHHGHDLIDWITAFNPAVYKQNEEYGHSSEGSYQYYQVEYEQETKPLNCYDNDRLGLYLRYQHQFASWLNVSAEGEGYYYKASTDIDAQYFLTSRLFGYESHPIGLPGLDGCGYRLALSADAFLNRLHTLMLSAGYHHWFSDYEGLTKYDAYGYFDIALRWSLLKDRLKFSLVAHDPFCQQIMNATRRYNRQLFTEYSHLNPHAHSISLTATWSIGGKAVRRVHRDTKDTESQRTEKR